MESKGNWLSFLAGRGKEPGQQGPALGTSPSEHDGSQLDAKGVSSVRSQFFQALELGGLEELYLTLSRPQVSSMDLLFAVSESPEYRTCMDLVISKSGHDNIRETPLAAWYLKNKGLSEGLFTPLHIVARNGHADLVSLLLRHLTANVGKNQMTVLASYTNKTTCAAEGLTPLHLAVFSPLKREPTAAKLDTAPGARKLMEDLMALNNCMGDRIACIEALAANGARLNLRAEIPGLYGSKGTALHMACVAFCDPETIQALVDAGADVHIDIVSEDPNLNGAAALHLAVRVGLLYEEPNVLMALRLLLAAGADPFAMATEGTAMHLACKYGFGDLACAVVHLLAEAMAGPSVSQAQKGREPMTVKEVVQMKVGGCTPLQYAAMNVESEQEVLAELVQLGAEVTGEEGAMALLLAMQTEDRELAKTKWLLEMGASSDVPVEVDVGEGGSPRTLTPVQWAFHAIAGVAKCEQPREVMMELLKVVLEYHQELPTIPLDPTGALHASPILFALRYFDLEFLGTMLVAGDDLNECYEVAAEEGKRWHNPITALLERRDLDDLEGLITLLVEAGADPRKRSELSNGGRPLHALVNGQEVLVQSLVALGLGINDTDDNADTPLACACQRGQMHVARMLMLNSARVDVHNKQGRTPLHLICMAPHSPHHLSMARSLLKAGADPTAKDLDGRTPLDYAKQVGSQDAVALLERFRRLQDAQAKAAHQRKLAAMQPSPSTLLTQALHSLQNSSISEPPSPTTAAAVAAAASQPGANLPPSSPLARRSTSSAASITPNSTARYGSSLTPDRPPSFTSIPVNSS